VIHREHRHGDDRVLLAEERQRHRRERDPEPTACGAPVTGQAVPSYGPQFAGEYFKKVECFCFTHQTLAAGETRRLPVTFVVDPRLPRGVNTIALSYTFFEVPGRGGRS